MKNIILCNQIEHQNNYNYTNNKETEEFIEKIIRKN